MTACDRLRELGYIWSAGGESRPYFRPEIPSLMQYMAAAEMLESAWSVNESYNSQVPAREREVPTDWDPSAVLVGSLTGWRQARQI